MSEALDIKLVQDTEMLRVWLYRGASRRLVVSFSPTCAPGEEPGYDLAAAATRDGQDNALFIADKTNSWLNAPGLIEEIVQWVEAYKIASDATEIMTLGQSMGGFMALAMPKFMPVDSAVAFAPQFSVHPEEVPEESRWAMYRRKISQFRIRSLDDTLVDNVAYFALHDYSEDEAPQRDRFPNRDNLTHLILPDAGKNVPQDMRRKGLLGEVVEWGFQNRPRKMRLSLAPLNVFRRHLDGEPEFPGSTQSA